MASPIVNLKGRIFGKLTVIELSTQRKNRKTMWKCVCECGNDYLAVGADLLSENTRSCGCIKRGRKVK